MYYYFVVYEYTVPKGYARGNMEIILNRRIKGYKDIQELKQLITNYEKTTENVLITDFKLMRRKLFFMK